MFDRSCLTRTVVPKDCNHLTRTHVHIDAVENFGCIFFILKANILEGDQGVAVWVQFWDSRFEDMERLALCPTSDDFGWQFDARVVNRLKKTSNITG